MKPSLISHIFILSLFFGTVGTIATVYTSSKATTDASCGYSISSRTGSPTSLTSCVSTGYGWPYNYVSAHSRRMVHTAAPSQPAYVGSTVATADVTIGQLAADWLFWFFLALGLIGGVPALVLRIQTRRRVRRHPTRPRRA